MMDTRRMESDPHHIIEVISLVKTFGEVKAVNDIGFAVERGDVFAFLGPNGAGKTTTIKMLTTLLTPTSGTILVNGSDPVRQQNEVRRSFGIVFQDPSSDDELTAYENMELHGVLYGVGADVLPVRIRELLTLVELWEKKDHQVKTFSGGMKRRLEIARGLLHRPEIFFLDEPTQGLDPQTRNKLWEYLLKLNQEAGITLFFTTHYIEEAEKYARNVAVIDHGKIAERGTPEELKTKTGKTTLEDAFLELTGHDIREEEASPIEHMRMRHVFHR